MSKKNFTVQGIEAKNPNSYGGMCSRAIALGQKAGKVDFTKGIETIATTEAPAEVIDWERWQIVREILPMRYMETPNNDKVPLLDSHSRVSIEKIKGSAKGFRTEGTDLICLCFVSDTEPNVKAKIEEGHIDSVSIGYMTDKEFTVEIPKKASVVIDGITYRNEYTDDMPLLVRTWWKAHELSLVPIGADEAAKFKASAESGNEKLLEKITNLQKEITDLKENKITTDEKLESHARSRRHQIFKLKNAQ